MNITTGTIDSCEKVVIYGPEGIGKSTLASNFPKPLFIDTEGSTKKLDVARTDRPTSWAMLMDQIQSIKRDHMGYQTLVIDTADWAEQLCAIEVCAKNKKKGIEDFGYGKGYTYLAEEFVRFLHLLEDIVDGGMNVVIIAHAMMRKFEQPDEMGAYDRWELKLQKKTAPLVKEWADVILFTNYKTFVVSTDNGKHKPQGGHRVMYTTHHPAWDAKNRHGLKEELVMDYSAIAHIFTNILAPAVVPPKQEPAPQPQAEAAPVQTPAVSTPPTAEVQTAAASPPTAEQEVPDLSAYVGIHGPLAQLMAANNVTEGEIRKAVAQKGYYPETTPIASYAEDFVMGAMVGGWNTVYETVKEMRGAN